MTPVQMMEILNPAVAVVRTNMDPDIEDLIVLHWNGAISRYQLEAYNLFPEMNRLLEEAKNIENQFVRPKKTKTTPKDVPGQLKIGKELYKDVKNEHTRPN